MSNYRRICSCCGIYAAGANYEGKFYCNKHWLRLYYHGTTELLERKSRSKFEIIGECCKITTSRGAEIIVDASDCETVKEYSWCISKTGYPVARAKDGRVIKLTRLLLDVTNPKLVIDHINGDPFDNRRKNLRICRNGENARNCKLSKNNTSGYVGVRQEKSSRWCASIMVNRKDINLGRYDTKEEAIRARQEAEKKYFGEFAPCRNIEYFKNYKLEEAHNG